MKIHVRSRLAEVDETMRPEIGRRLLLSLDKFSARILRVSVNILNMTGPRDSGEKVCRIEVRLKPSGSVFVEGRDSHVLTAVDLAAVCADWSLSRAIKYTRDNGLDPALKSDSKQSSTTLVVVQ